MPDEMEVIFLPESFFPPAFHLPPEFARRRVAKNEVAREDVGRPVAPPVADMRGLVAAVGKLQAVVVSGVKLAGAKTALVDIQSW